MRIQLFILNLFLTVFLFSCSTTDKQSKVIISGKTNVLWSNTINLRHGTVSLAESWSGQTDHRDSIIPLKEDGTFNVQLILNVPLLYSLSHQEQKVEFIVFPGDSIHIDLTSETVFSGSNANQNNHLIRMEDEMNKIVRYISKDESAFFGADIDQYSKAIDSLELAYLSVNNNFKENNEQPAIYSDKIENDITYRSKFHKIIYPAIHEMYTGDTLSIDQSYYDNIATGSFNNPKLLELGDYVLFLDRFTDIMSSGNLRFRNYYDAGIQKIEPKYYAIKALDANQEIKDYLMNEHLKKSISNYGISYLGDIISDYKLESKNTALKQEVLDMISAQEETRTEPDTILVYKRVGNVQLEAHMFYPQGHDKTQKSPVYAFFHGGGWAVGIPEWGYRNCKRYQEKGMVSVSFEYRLIDIHGSNIINCIEDANSAILWLRQEADSFGINADRIVAAGFSAGGHLAASTAILDEFNIGKESGLNSRPNAFIAHSASYDTTKSNFFKRQSEGRPESISTFHNVRAGLPPSISFHGTRDHLAPINEFTAYKDKMEDMNNDFEYKIFEGVGHFFNDEEASKEVRELTDAFLSGLGYLN